MTVMYRTIIPSIIKQLHIVIAEITMEYAPDIFQTLRTYRPIPKELERHLEDTEIKPDEYMKRAYKHILKAYKLLGEGIEDEACEEAWRATIEALNAIAVELWGKRIRSHKGLALLVDWLAESGIVDIRVEYGNAGSLHTHYYTLEQLGVSTIRSNILQVEKLIAKIQDALLELKEQREIQLIPQLPIVKLPEIKPPILRISGF